MPNHRTDEQAHIERIRRVISQIRTDLEHLEQVLGELEESTNTYGSAS